MPAGPLPARLPAPLARLAPLVLLGLGLALLAGCEAPAPPPDDPGPGPAAEDTAAPDRAEGRSLVFLRNEEPVTVERPGRADLAATLEALLEGPTRDEQEAGLTSILTPVPGHPARSDPRQLLESVEVGDDGTATVSFTGLREALPSASSSAGSRALLLQLNGTAFAVEGVERIRWEIDGSCEAFWTFLQRSCTVVERGAPEPVP